MLRHSSNKMPSSFSAVVIVFGLLFLCNGPVIASDVSSDFRINGKYIKKFKGDFVDVVKSPIAWKKKDAFNLSVVVGMGAVLLAFDPKISDWSQEQRSSKTDNVSRFVSPLGSGAFFAVFIPSLYASGEIFHERSLRKTALLSLESWLTSGVIVYGLKWMTGRARPSTTEEAYFFHPFSARSGYHSFPSGHSSSAFAVATVIAEQSEEFVVDFIAYSLSTLAALSRIHDKKHWASDVFIGSVIGYCVGKKISALNRDNSSDRIQLTFLCSHGRRGLTLTIFF